MGLTIFSEGRLLASLSVLASLLFFVVWLVSKSENQSLFSSEPDFVRVNFERQDLLCGSGNGHSNRSRKQFGDKGLAAQLDFMYNAPEARYDEGSAPISVPRAPVGPGPGTGSSSLSHKDPKYIEETKLVFLLSSIQFHSGSNVV